VSRFRVGERVITMMQGRGGVRARRPGGYSEYVVIAEDAAAPVPPISMSSTSPRSASPA
jgi:NADPH:quinone reductase